MGLQVVIIEDEPLAVEKLHGFIQRYQPAAQVIAVLQSVQAVVEFFDTVQAASVQLVISDIELQDGQVFQALQQLSLSCPLLIISAYPQYGLAALAQQAVGYLLKPYSYQSFSQAMANMFALRERLQLLPGATGLREAGADCQPQHREFISNETSSHISVATVLPRQRFLIRHSNGSLVPLPLQQISCIQAVRGVLVATDQQSQQHLLSETQLSELADELQACQFFRLNRSELIYLPAVLKLESHGKDHLAVYLNGVPAPLISSKNRTAELRQVLSR